VHACFAAAYRYDGCAVPSPRARAAGVSLVLAALSCGGGQTRGHPLDRSWSDEDGTELAAFVRDWAPPRPRPTPDLAVGVIDGRSLAGCELERGAPWRFEHELDGRPVLAGELVVGLGGGELFALDGRSGELVWARPAVGSLRGAGDDGTTTVVSLGSLSRERSIVLAVARDGAVVRQLDVVARVGVPAVRDAVAFLPWNDRFVAVFDLAAGREQARVESTTTVSRAWVAEGELFFGDRRVLLFDRAIVAARRGEGSELGLPAREFPGAPGWLRSDVVRLLARPRVTAGPSGGKELRWAEDGYALLYRQVALGLDAATGATRWAHTNAVPFLAGEAARTELCLCDTAGTVRFLGGRTGVPTRERTLGSPLRACVLQCAGSDRAAPELRPAAGASLPAAARVRGLLDALRVHDRELLPLQLELVADLAGIEGEEATAGVIALASAEQTPAELRTEASRLLAARRTGDGAMLRELERAAAEPTWAPINAPIDALAQAVGAMRIEAAAGALGTLLLRPALRPEQALGLIEALASLGGAGQTLALEAFVAGRACGQDDDRWIRAVQAAARALLGLGRPRLLQALVDEPCENERLRSRIEALLTTNGVRGVGGPNAVPGPLAPVF
jgi:outer membrane protein assembly factor BamB